MAFKIKTKTGTYRVNMRQSLRGINSERKLRRRLQESIDRYAKKPGWEEYAAALQAKLDDDDLMDIASIFGMFSGTKRVE